MKEQLFEIYNKLQEIDKQYDFNVFETAIYTYMRYGISDMKQLKENQIEEIAELVNNFDSIFDEDLNLASCDYFLPF